jgi:ubiquinol-cytochrome c reductase iron-sulfur subunit
MSRDGGSRTGAGGWASAGLLIAVDALVSGFRWFAKKPINADFGTSEGNRGLDITTRNLTSRRRNWGTFLVFCAYAISVIGAVGFLMAYWTGASNQTLGGTLALALGGFGSALVLYSHWLMARKEATEPREALPSSSEERQATLESFHAGKNDVGRRGFLTWMVASISLLFAAIVVSLVRSLGQDPDPSLFDTVWKRGERLVTENGTFMSADSLRPGDAMTVFPEGSVGSERAQTVLIRVKEELLRLPADRADWAPLGYLAYSRVCTHAGCPVGIYEKTSCLLLCPCHQSTFEVLEAAHPNGGPATRPLPQLPLYIDEGGTLRAGGPFTDPPGPGFWGMTNG